MKKQRFQAKPCPKCGPTRFVAWEGDTFWRCKPVKDAGKDRIHSKNEEKRE